MKSAKIGNLRKKVEFEIEPFEWISPELIIGYSIENIREINLGYFRGELEKSEFDEDRVDEIIADYYLECDSRNPNISLLLKYGIWLIKDLYSSYTAHIYPLSMRSNILNEDVDDIFIEIYENFHFSIIMKDYHSANLLKIFTFELLQYGSEWGIFVNIDNKKSIARKNLKIEDADKELFLCASLSKENLKYLEVMEIFAQENIT